MIIQTWGNVLEASFQGLWAGVISFIPNLIIAIVIVLIGWGIASILQKVVKKFFDTVKFDEALEKAGLGNVVRRAGLSLNSGHFLGSLVKLFVVVAFLIAGFDVLGLTQVTMFLQNIVLGYVPQLIIAVLILLVGAVVGDVLQKIVIASTKTAGVTSSELLGKISKWAIWIFAILVALSQMGIAGAFIQTLFTGFVVALSLALGLSFGLGGQDAASDIIKKVRHEIGEKK
jgi:small-conductance mechanosensitive channel